MKFGSSMGSGSGRRQLALDSVRKRADHLIAGLAGGTRQLLDSPRSKEQLSRDLR